MTHDELVAKVALVIEERGFGPLDQRHQLAQAIVAVVPQVDTAAQRALESLTPSGSEFYNNVDGCRQWIEQRLSRSHKLAVREVKERRRIEAREANLVVALKYYAGRRYSGTTAGVAREALDAYEQEVRT